MSGVRSVFQAEEVTADTSVDAETPAIPQENPGNGLAALMHQRTRDAFGALNRLPGSRYEIQAIARIVRTHIRCEDAAMKLLFRGDATTGNLVSAANSPRFLHLATHALALGADQIFGSALALSNPDQITAEDYGFILLDVLLRSWGGQAEWNRPGRA